MYPEQHAVINDCPMIISTFNFEITTNDRIGRFVLEEPKRCVV